MRRRRLPAQSRRSARRSSVCVASHGVDVLVRCAIIGRRNSGIRAPDAILDCGQVRTAQRHATLRMSINLEEPFSRYDCDRPMTLHARGPMTALATKTSAKRRLLLASDRYDQSRELARILAKVADVETVPTAELPESPARDLSGVVVDINLRSAGDRAAGAAQAARWRLPADAAAVRAGRSNCITARCRPGRSAPPTPSRGRSIPRSAAAHPRGLPEFGREISPAPSAEALYQGRRRRAPGAGQDLRAAAGRQAA